MNKFYGFLLVTILVSCGQSNSNNDLNQLKSFLTSLEKTKQDCQEKDWLSLDDSIQYHDSKINARNISPDEREELDSLKVIYEQIKAKTLIKPTVNFYLDNSLSMQGYFKGEGFRPILAELLFKEKQLNYNLFFCNNKVQLQSKWPEEFFELLNDFEANITATQSDINNTFGSILSSITDSTIGIFISDGIYSMGDASKSLEELRIKKTLTTVEFEEELAKNPSTNTVVFKMESHFYGTYYDQFDEEYKLDGPRPFYIWFMGNSININRLLCKLDLDSHSGFKEKARFYGISKNDCAFTITKYGEVGHFKNQFGDTLWHEVKDVEVAEAGINQGKFGCSIAVDFSKLECEASYLLNHNNYQVVGGGFEIDSIIPIGEYLLTYEESLRELKYRSKDVNFNPSHLLFISTTSFEESAVKITLTNKEAQWISASSSINAIPDGQTTFGFEYLMNGISDAYKNQNKNINFTEFNIKLKR